MRSALSHQPIVHQDCGCESFEGNSGCEGFIGFEDLEHVFWNALGALILRYFGGPGGLSGTFVAGWGGL